MIFTHKSKPGIKEELSFALAIKNFLGPSCTFLGCAVRLPGEGRGPQQHTYQKYYGFPQTFQIKLFILNRSKFGRNTWNKFKTRRAIYTTIYIHNRYV